MQDGLSQMKISSLHQDKNGYIWIGTRNGLNRFNGETFEVYTTDEGLLHNRIHQLGELSDGRLAILTYNGLNLFDGARFEAIEHPFLSVVYQLIVDNENQVWINDPRENRLIKIDLSETTRATRITEIFNGKTGKASHLQYNPENDKKYFIANSKLFKIVGDDLEFLRKYDFNIFGSRVGSLDPVPFTIHRSTNDFIGKIFDENNDQDIFITDRVLNTKNLLPNRVWFSNSDLLSLPFGKEQRTRVEKEFLYVNDVIEDNLGQLWLGAENGLVQMYNPAFKHYSYSELPYVWSIIEDTQKNLWFSSFGYGLFKMGKDQVIQSAFATSKIGPHFFAGSTLNNKGQLYFTHLSGLFKIEDNSQFSRVLPQTTFYVFYDPVQDHILAGTYNGIIIIDNSGNQNFIGEEHGVHDNDYIQAIGIDKNDDYWLGSYGGVSKVDGISNKVKTYSFSNSIEKSSGFYCFLNDSHGEFWMGSDDGLVYYDSVADSLVLIKSNVLNKMVKSLIELDENRILIGAKDGLYVFNKTEYLTSGEQSFRLINLTNGYLGIEPGFTGFYKDSQGHIWITSSTSVDRLDPDLLDLEGQQLKAQITLINNENIPFNHKEINYKNPYNQANISINVDAIGLTRPTKVKYQYRLENEDWSEWLENSEISFPELSDGMYTLEVRAGPIDQYDASLSDFLDFSIHLPFYRATWFPFVSISLATVLLLSTFFYFYRQRRIAQRYKSQLEEVGYLRNQLLLSEMNPHFVFNVLAAIQNKIITGQKEMASQYVVKLSKLIRNFLESSYKSNYSNTLTPEFEIPLSKELELLTSYVEFEQIKSDRHFTFEFIDDTKQALDSVFIPPMLLQPFIENAIKHGLLPKKEGGHLMVKFEYLQDELICTITDSGIGRKKAREMQKSQYKTRESLGQKIIEERIAILNDLGYSIAMEVKDLDPSGTKVTVTIKDED